MIDLAIQMAVLRERAEHAEMDAALLRAEVERLRAVRDLVPELIRNCSCPMGDCTTCTEARAALAASEGQERKP
jgi:hypothetical protein